MVRKPSIDYDPAYPLTGVEKSSPVSVTPPDPEDMPAGPQDYIPPSGEFLPPNAAPKPAQPECRTDARPTSEYVPFEEVEKIEAARKARIKAEAIRIWNEAKEANEDYKNYKRLVDSATDEQWKDPTPELLRAKNIVDQGEPMTKARAVAEARRIEESRDRNTLGS